jgi:micrococcal nuclease
MALVSFLAAASICAAPVVHDGDSIRCGAERIRIANIDAPEMPGSPKCVPAPKPWADCDYAKGARAREALAAFLASGPVTIERQQLDRYGRTLALLTVNGKDAGEYLISLGLARRWEKAWPRQSGGAAMAP